jgi:hypothetical protein
MSPRTDFAIAHFSFRKKPSPLRTLGADRETVVFRENPTAKAEDEMASEIALLLRRRLRQLDVFLMGH